MVKIVKSVQVILIKYVIIMVNVGAVDQEKEMVNAIVTRVTLESIVVNVQRDIMNLIKMIINYFAQLVMVLVLMDVHLVVLVIV